MDKKIEGICLRMAKLSCACVAQEFAGVNGLKDVSSIQMKVRDKGRLMSAIYNIMKGADPASMRREVEMSLSVHCTRSLKHSVNWVQVFLQSVARCVDARVCQKRMLDLLAAEQYLQAAYDYDMQHRSNSATKAARKALTAIHSERFLQAFTPYGRPKIDANMKAALFRRGFDSRYAFTSEASVQAMADARFHAVYVKRNDFFLKAEGPQAGPVMPHTAALVTERKKAPRQMRKPVIPVPEKSGGMPMDMVLLNAMYGDGFVDMPLKGKRRRFVNLAAKAKDLMDCPLRLLRTKRRFLEIESMTKHSYIYGFYDDGLRGSMTPEAVLAYYMQREAEMCQLICHTDRGLRLDGRTLVLPDGRAVAVPAKDAPYVQLHRVNTIYAAMFGFTADDTRGGMKWLEDSVRSAYTDEGMADYRLAVVDARLSGRAR